MTNRHGYRTEILVALSGLLFLVIMAAGAPARAVPYCAPGDPATCQALQSECRRCIKTPDDHNGCNPLCADAAACRSGHYVTYSYQHRKVVSGCVFKTYCAMFTDYVEYANARVRTQVFEDWECFTSGQIYWDVLRTTTYQDYPGFCSAEDGWGYCVGGDAPSCEIHDINEHRSNRC
jgi:hypothetical protein